MRAVSGCGLIERLWVEYLLFDMANQSILNFQLILNILNLSNAYLKVFKAHWKKLQSDLANPVLANPDVSLSG